MTSSQAFANVYRKKWRDECQACCVAGWSIHYCTPVFSGEEPQAKIILPIEKEIGMNCQWDFAAF